MLYETIAFSLFTCHLTPKPLAAQGTWWRQWWSTLILSSQLTTSHQSPWKGDRTSIVPHPQNFFFFLPKKLQSQNSIHWWPHYTQIVRKTDLVDRFINIQVLFTSEEVTAHFQSKREGLHRYYIRSCTRRSSGCSFGLGRTPELCTGWSFGSATPLVRRQWLFVGIKFLISVAILVSLDHPLYYANGGSEAIII